MPKRSTNRRPDKPAKPYKDYPLFAHGSGRWAKKINGRLFYFGRWATVVNGALTPVVDTRQAAQDAADLYERQREDLYAGRKPREDDSAVTVGFVADEFLIAKRRAVEAGELKRGTYDQYFATCARLVDALGKARPVDDLRAEDFAEFRAKLAKRLGPAELGKQIGVVRSAFKYAYENHIIDRPMRYGSEFKRPSRKVLRKTRRAKASKMLSADNIKAMIDKADPAMKAMILLGINGGFGNTDCAELRLSDIDLKAGTIDYPRPKTEIERRVTLWSETVKAIKAAIAARKTPKRKADADLVFVTMFGNPWIMERAKEGKRSSRTDSVNLQFCKLLDELNANGDGIGFYSLRHTFRTVADEVGDRPAVDRIMGHENVNDMAVHYRERIDDDRLRKVTDHVRTWLYGKSAKRQANGTKKAKG